MKTAIVAQSNFNINKLFVSVVIDTLRRETNQCGIHELQADIAESWIVINYFVIGFISDYEM